MDTAMEPVSTAAGSYTAGKFALGAGGLIGGLSISAFWQPKKLLEYGKLAAAGITTGIAVGGSITLGGVLARYLQADIADMDTALGVGVLVGVMVVFILNSLANLFKKYEDQDLAQVAKAVRTGKAPAKRKPAAKKVARKVVKK